MEKTSPGQIHLADQRVITENNTFRRCSTFNYDGHFNEHRKAFGPLRVFNDEILAAGKSITIQVQHACYFVAVPVTGALLVEDAEGKSTVVDVGEVYINYANSGDVLTLNNPYPNHWVNFLQLQIDADTEVFPFFKQTFSFDFEGRQNELISIIPTLFRLPFNLHIGRFDGRADALYRLKAPGSLFYAFVIAGAFELQGRLMHERDGLALWGVEEADMEALSNSAVMLVLEMEG
ncbi:pirin family protein [Mucilaginibacter ginsenosidivorax]|uniref:Quercetin 2,3-dioxygenase C-terminal cupin domain-containing protein n=1 Tax=Mucilaginibacter ginsenosidivorax TaxID=862126 RepID=A0A5B8VUM5_9SPHI|nr:hypothetical protein [Mucilaginibacter ginsenosidivorax]QEC75149.1 hypothetical protein FSB76_04010 [Mucilaginibacter ginsenosidivorax]